MEIFLGIVVAIFKGLGIIFLAWTILEVGLAADAVRKTLDPNMDGPETFWSTVENLIKNNKKD